jgi:hypothetical protein
LPFNTHIKANSKADSKLFTQADRTKFDERNLAHSVRHDYLVAAEQNRLRKESGHLPRLAQFQKLRQSPVKLL